MFLNLEGIVEIIISVGMSKKDVTYEAVNEFIIAIKCW